MTAGYNDGGILSGAHMFTGLPPSAPSVVETAAQRHTVYYRACPVCDAGVCAMRARIAEGEVEWVDLHHAPERLVAPGLDLEAVRERLHLVGTKRRLQVGAAALLKTWSPQSNRCWLLRPMNLPGMRALTAWAYNAFACELYRWNRRQGHC
jgi:predicted DCC family thiol-disulfide oxidoreductase YuxK